MSDQADHLRQLVRAHRAWRELAMEEPSATIAAGCSKPTQPMAPGTGRKGWTPGLDLSLGLGLRAAQVARWALSHVGR